MCKFFLQGQCDHGGACSYAHSPDEIRNKPDLTNTSMCKMFAREGHCTLPDCRFAHSEAQLRATSGFFKMKMCGFAQSGRCKNGDNCRFAHSPDELRPPNPVEVQKRQQQQLQRQQQKQAQRQQQELQPPPAASGQLFRGILEEQAQGFQVPHRMAVDAASDVGAGAATVVAPGVASSSALSGPTSRRGRWSDAQDSSSGRGNQSTGSGQQDGSDSAEGSAEGGSQEGSSSRFSGHSSLTEVPRSDHTSTHSGTTTFTGESGNGATGSGTRTSAAATSKGDGSDASGGGGSGNSAAVTTAGSSREQYAKTKLKKPVSEQAVDKHGVTTLVISNVPTYFTQGALLSMFEDLTPSMRGVFDFFYCPWDEQAMKNLGHATINFPSVEQAAAFQQEWTNRELCRGGHWQKRLKITKASVQGWQANLEYFSRVKVTETVDQRFRPIFRDETGLLNPLELAEDAQVEPTVPQPRARRAQAASQPPPLEEVIQDALRQQRQSRPMLDDTSAVPGASAPGQWQGCPGGYGELAAQTSFQAPDALPWPHMLMMVSGGAGHVQWPQQTMQPPLTGQGSGAQDAGYQTPELSENDAEFAGHQRGPFQPMVPCMMMPMEAFVSMDGQHARRCGPSGLPFQQRLFRYE